MAMSLSATHRATARFVRTRHVCPHDAMNMLHARKRNLGLPQAAQPGQAPADGDATPHLDRPPLTEAEKASKRRRKLLLLNLEVGFYYLVLVMVQFFFMVAPNIYVNVGDTSMPMSRLILKRIGLHV